MNADCCVRDHECLPPLERGCDAGTSFFTEGDDLYSDMLGSIESAQRSVCLESYIFSDDEIGRRFADVLARKASQGARVRVLLDAEGSRSRCSKRLLNQLRHRGVEVHVFRPWKWGSPRAYWRRDHRKLLVVDDEIAYLGGFNIHRESSRACYGKARWRDSHVRLRGSAAKQAAECFSAFWRRDLHWEPEESASPCCILIPNQTRACLRRLRCIYAGLFDGAKASIQITTPYFVPDHRTQRSLVEAARRGVEVSLLVPQKSDVPIARWAGRAAYARLLAAGVRIHEYRPRMLHAKTATIDGEWATIGTANMDYRSLLLNYELSLITRDERVCHLLQAQFDDDLRQSTEIGASAWRQRKWTEYPFETIGWLSRRWL